MPAGNRFSHLLLGNQPISIGNYLLLISLHLPLLICCFYLLKIVGLYEVGFFDSRLQWDAGWYYSIVKNGYSYFPDKASNVAFFPLFPWLWQLTGLDANGIAVVNTVVFLLSFYLLARSFKLTTYQTLLLISFPSLMFCFIPYSEALFFLGGTLMLVGMKNQSLWPVMIGIVITCLDRKIGGVFSLCILLTFFLTTQASPGLGPIISMALLVLLVFGISTFVKQYQVYEAGTQFDYFDVIAQWYRVLRLPELPLSTTNLHWHNVWLDFFALFIGSVSGIFLIYYMYSTTRGTRLDLPQELVFSLFYLAGTTAIVLIFSPNFGNRGTNIHGLHRYLMATPFFFIVLLYAARRVRYTKNVLKVIIAIAALVWFSFSIPVHPQNLTIKFQFLSLAYFAFTYAYFVGFFKVISGSRFKKYAPVFFLVNTFFQALLIGKFMSGTWVG